MEQYLRFRPLRAAIDRIGATLLICCLCVGWFVFLWGLGPPAVLAGLALSTLVLLALRKGGAQATQKREAALRRRLGGELAMEALMLAPAKQAHFRAGLILAEKYPLKMDKITDFGMFCHDDQGEILVFCICAAPQGNVSAQALLPMVRTAKEHKIRRCAACTTSSFSKEASAFAEFSDICIRLFDRNRLLPVASRLFPATDEQLAALAQRKKRLPIRSIASHMLKREKAKKYISCGLMLASVFIATGLKWYAFPALLCMLLAALCRMHPAEPERL